MCNPKRINFLTKPFVGQNIPLHTKQLADDAATLRDLRSPLSSGASQFSSPSHRLSSFHGKLTPSAL